MYVCVYMYVHMYVDKVTPTKSTQDWSRRTSLRKFALDELEKHVQYPFRVLHLLAEYMTNKIRDVLRRLFTIYMCMVIACLLNGVFYE